MPMFPSALIPQVAERGASPQLDNVDRRGTHGESIIAAVKGAGEMAAKIAVEEKAKADTAAIVQAETDYMAHLNATQTDLHQYRGATLEDRDQLALKSVEDVRLKIAKGLKNDTQRSEFERRSLSHRESTTANINSYAVQQRTAAVADSLQARKKIAIDTAALNLDPDAVLAPDADEVVVAQGALEGWSPQRLALERQDFQAKGLSAVINGYLKADDPARAKALFDQHKAVFGADADKIEEAITNKRFDNVSRQTAGELLAKAKGNPHEAEKLVGSEVKDARLAKKVNDWLGGAKENWERDQEQALAEVNIKTRQAGGVLDDSDPMYTNLDAVRREKAMAKSVAVKAQNRPRTGSSREQRDADDKAEAIFVYGTRAEDQIAVAPEGASGEEVMTALESKFPNASDGAVKRMMKSRAKLIDERNKGTLVHRQAALDSLNAEMVGLSKRVQDENRKALLDQYNAIEKPTREQVDALVEHIVKGKVQVQRKTMGVTFTRTVSPAQVRATDVRVPQMPAVSLEGLDMDIRAQVEREIASRGKVATPEKVNEITRNRMKKGK